MAKAKNQYLEELFGGKELYIVGGRAVWLLSSDEYDFFLKRCRENGKKTLEYKRNPVLENRKPPEGALCDKVNSAILPLAQ
jgi:hypothetical protein